MPSKPSQKKRDLPTGVRRRHSRRCPTASGGECNAGKRDGCTPSYRAWVYDRRIGEKVEKTFATLAEAKAWRASATTKLAQGKRVATSRQTLREAALAWLAGVKADPPTILSRSDRPFKPSTVREYERNLENYLLPELGAQRLADIRRGDLQAFAERLRGQGLSGSKVRNIILPLRVIYRHELDLERVQENPTLGLRLPNGGKPRDRAASPAEAAELLRALPPSIRAIYATAAYAGLRRGELMALRWSSVDLAGGVIRVASSWDEQAGEIEPKSAKGTRTVPIVALLRDELADLKAASGRSGADFVFGRKPSEPFTPSYVRKQAALAWERAPRIWRSGEIELLDPIGLHECRHTFVSLLFDAGLPLERIGDYVGHSSTYMTDRYRHLLEGHEIEAARIVDAYLARSDTAARLEQLDQS